MIAVCDAYEAMISERPYSVATVAPVDLEVPDRLVEALRGEGPRVGEPDSLSAAEVVHPG